MKNSDKNQTNKSEQHSLVKIVTIILLLLIIVVVLLTSCTSDFFGKIGTLFENFSEYIFKNNDKNIEKIYNQELKFINNNGEVLLDDTYKVEYIYGDINPTEVSCITSKADIATCIVKNNYVEVYPKTSGKVTISIITKINGKEYIGTHELTINDVERKISLFTKNKTIYLNETNSYRFSYELVNIEGNVESIVSDEKILSAYIKNNTLVVISKKTGSTTVTIQVKYKGKTYTDTLEISIKEKRPEVIKSSEKSLEKIEISCGNLQPDFNKDILNYEINVNSTISTIKISITKADEKSKTYYYLNDVRIDSLNNLKLNSGNNKLVIVVQAEDNTTKKYTININKENEQPIIKSDINTLDNITGLNINFNKNILNYNVEVNDSIVNINVYKTDEKSKVEYYIDNIKHNNLNNINLETNKIINIKVISESGKERVYTLNITKKDNTEIKSDINTLDNITGLNINFNKNILNYNVEVNDSIVNINVYKTDEKSKVEYYIDNIKHNNLNNINLETNKIINIKVISESGKERVYTLNITKKDNTEIKSDINTLDNLIIKNYNLDFDKNVNDYTMIVDYNTSQLSLSYDLTDTKSTIKFKLNSNYITNNNMLLKEGINTLEIIVTSESNISNIYTLIIKKPIRKIVLDKNKSTINIEEGNIDIIYNVYEDRNIDNNFILIDNYNINDITISIPSFKGKYELNKGYITLKLSNEDINNNYELNINYLNKQDKTKFKVIMNDYYINTIKDNYYFDYYNNNNIVSIILNTNIFNNDIKVTTIDNGIKLYNNKGYINLTSSNSNTLKIIKDIENDNSNYISFKSQLLNSGIVTININGNVYGKNITNKSITLNITRKYSVTIDANGGNFNSFTNSYNFLKDKDEIINLSDYIPYKVDKTGNCLYYTLQSYNTKADGTGTVIDKNATITIDSDLILYAIYNADSQYIEIEEDNTIYLTDVDLFHNEEYYNYYNIDKVIYPNANGSHAMYLTNNLDSTIKINRINLKENTTCIDMGCINMGYIVKYTKQNENNWNYVYGNEREYKILNLDPNITKSIVNGYENTISIETGEIILNPGESTTISLLWEWVDIDDVLDTKIGSIATEEYSILVSLDYSTTNTYCNIN